MGNLSSKVLLFLDTCHSGQLGRDVQAKPQALEQGQADYSNDGTIHLRELDLYVAERVEALTDGEQHPTTQKPSTISLFPIVQVK